MNPLLEGMSDESKSSAEGDGDNELVCWKLKSSWLMSLTTWQVHISIPTLPSADYLFVRFACTFLPQFDKSPSPQIHSRKLHSVLPPSNRTTRSLWPPTFSTPRRHPPPARAFKVSRPSRCPAAQSSLDRRHNPNT